MKTLNFLKIIKLIVDNLDAKIQLDLKRIIKNGKTHVYTSKMNLNLDLKTFDHEFDEKEKELVNVHQIFNDIVNNNEEEILRKVKPVIEEKISTRIISVFNKLLRQNYFEELFPEQI